MRPREPHGRPLRRKSPNRLAHRQEHCERLVFSPTMISDHLIQCYERPLVSLPPPEEREAAWSDSPAAGPPPAVPAAGSSQPAW